MFSLKSFPNLFSSIRINRTVTILRKEFMYSIKVGELAKAAGMSVSVFHKYFRRITTLSPLQFQNQLRLINVQNIILIEGVSISQAAYTVGLSVT